MTCRAILEYKANPGWFEKLGSYGTEIVPNILDHDGGVALVVVQNQDEPTSLMRFKFFNHFGT